MGVSAVNAVSEFLEMTIERDGKKYHQRYEAGVPNEDLSEIGTSSNTGTTIQFKPDLQVFTTVLDFDLDIINTRLKETAFLNAGLKITIKDEREEDPVVFEHEYNGGISEFVSQINANKSILHDQVIHFSGEREIEIGPISVEIACLLYTSPSPRDVEESRMPSSA